MASQPFNMSEPTSLGAGGGERVTDDIANSRGTRDQPTPASRYTATLLQLTDAAMSGIAISQLARRMLNASSRVLRADAGYVVEVRSGARVLSVLASRGLPMVIPRSTLDEGNAGARLLESGAPMLAVSDYDLGGFAKGLVLKEAGVRRGLTALIRGTEAPYGFLGLYAPEARSWAARRNRVPATGGQRPQCCGSNKGCIRRPAGADVPPGPGPGGGGRHGRARRDVRRPAPRPQCSRAGTIIEFWIPIPGSGEPSAVTAVTDTIPAPA